MTSQRLDKACCMLHVLLYALLQGVVSLQHQGTDSCHYGTQPGFWVPANGTDGTWQLYDEHCQLQDLVGPHIQHSSEGSASPMKQGILFFGDSVDFRFVLHYCQAIGQVHEAFVRPEHHGTYSGICRNTSGLTLAKQHISGANLDGPYWKDVHFPPIQSIDEGLKEYGQVMGFAPDVIVVASTFWDLANWFAAAGMNITGSVMEDEKLPPFLLQQWRHNMTQVLSFLKGAVAEDTLLIYHTLHSPRWNDGPQFWEHDPYLSQHVSQLNAVGRHVAKSLHFHILALDAMAAQVHQDTLLDDSTHPKPWFTLQALNVILNMELEHREHIQALRDPSKVNWKYTFEQRFALHSKP